MQQKSKTQQFDPERIDKRETMAPKQHDLSGK